MARPRLSDLKRQRRALARAAAARRKAAASTAGPAVSPLAPKAGFPTLPVIDGVTFAATAAGIKYRGRDDVMLALLAPGTVMAGTFTKSVTRSANVLDCEAKIGQASDQGAAIIVNSGNSNAFTGRAGDGSVQSICAAVSDATGLPSERVFTSSTGVIGERLPHERIVSKIGELVSAQSASGIEAAAEAIRTTDTFAKGASATVTLPDGSVQIAGIAKGSGMIAPDMATMLVYIFTDAVLPQDVLQTMTSRLCNTSFNSITVDSDTSTSDTLLVAATGASGVGMDDQSATAFETALGHVMRELAHLVVRDGEGATKFIEVSITGATSDADAKRAALAVANSPLVKTAVAGEDPNWGRVVMAVGKSGAEADRDRIAIRFGDLQVAEHGWVSDAYSEEDAAAYMRGEEICISVDLGLGHGAARVWTCDLTHDYISINADYRS